MYNPGTNQVRITVNRILARVLLALIAGLGAGIVSAHSDMEKPVCVAESGTDEGRCLDPAAPCRTIAYALGRVGQARVAGGKFEIANSADLFQIVSGVSDIRGGFDASDLVRRPGRVPTT